MSAPEAVVYVVRHGRTGLNAAGRLRGRLDPHLDDVGEEEARSLGEAFATMTVSALVASPLRRALQTASQIAARTGQLLEVDDRLGDRDYGPWAGSRKEEVLGRFGSLDDAPGVEDNRSFSARSLAGFRAAAERSRFAPAIVVSHDAVNRAVLSSLVPELGGREVLSQRTGCWNRLERRAGVWRATALDVRPGEAGPR